jgi:2-oxoglutarate dehydrogenase complex dehydrogenase (E1) component-like enzyme
MMIRAYRIRGHLAADLDPLGAMPTKPGAASELDPATYGFTDADMDRRSSSTTCWASNTRRCARSSTS